MRRCQRGRDDAYVAIEARRSRSEGLEFRAHLRRAEDVRSRARPPSRVVEMVKGQGGRDRQDRRQLRQGCAPKALGRVCQGLHARLARALGVQAKSAACCRLAPTHTEFARKHSCNDDSAARLASRSCCAFLTVTLLGASIARARGHPGLDRARRTATWSSLAYGPLDTTKTPPVPALLLQRHGVSPCSTCIRRSPAARAREKLTIELSRRRGDRHRSRARAAHDEASGVTFAEASDIEVKPVLAVLRAEGAGHGQDRATNATLPSSGRAEAVESIQQRLSAATRGRAQARRAASAASPCRARRTPRRRCPRHRDRLPHTWRAACSAR